MKTGLSDLLNQSSMTTAVVPDITPATDFDVWTHWRNTTETDRDPLGGRPHPSLYSWTHIGLSSVVVTAIVRAGSLSGHWQHRDQRLDDQELLTFVVSFSQD